MISPGIKPGTRAWLFAVSMYNAHDEDITRLCFELEKAWDELELLKGTKGKKDGKTAESVSESGTVCNSGSAGSADDEWNSGG